MATKRQQVQPNMDAPVLLIHPFSPNGSPGISSERGPGMGYTADTFTGNWCIGEWVFDMAICLDSEGQYWFRRWGKGEIWHRMDANSLMATE